MLNKIVEDIINVEDEEELRDWYDLPEDTLRDWYNLPEDTTTQELKEYIKNYYDDINKIKEYYTNSYTRDFDFDEEIGKSIRNEFDRELEEFKRYLTSTLQQFNQKYDIELDYRIEETHSQSSGIVPSHYFYIELEDEDVLKIRFSDGHDNRVNNEDIDIDFREYDDGKKQKVKELIEKAIKEYVDSNPQNIRENVEYNQDNFNIEPILNVINKYSKVKVTKNSIDKITKNNEEIEIKFKTDYNTRPLIDTEDYDDLLLDIERLGYKKPVKIYWGRVANQFGVNKAINIIVLRPKNRIKEELETLWDTLNRIDEEIKQSKQEYTSANTSINSSKLPAIFRLVNFRPHTINLDYGGGRFDNATEYLKGENVENLIYDPYNRTKEHNDKVIEKIRQNNGADTCTLSNVLNVVKEKEIRQEILKNIQELLKDDGTLYITVYEGTGNADEKETKAGYQLNRKTRDYIEEIEDVFRNVTKKGKLIIARD